MKHGHVTGHKQEHKGASAWYTAQEEENIRKIEVAWEERETQAMKKQPPEQEGA